MTPTFDPLHIEALVFLTLEIGDLRVKLLGAKSRIEDRNPPSEIDERGNEIIEAAFASESDLVSISNSIRRRMDDADAVAAVVIQPLNAFEEAHFELARQNAQAIDAYCASRFN